MQYDLWNSFLLVRWHTTTWAGTRIVFSLGRSGMVFKHTEYSNNILFVFVWNNIITWTCQQICKKKLNKIKFNIKWQIFTKYRLLLPKSCDCESIIYLGSGSLELMLFIMVLAHVQRGIFLMILGILGFQIIHFIITNHHV